MFKHTTYLLGEYLIDKYQDENGNSLSIAPSRGATILQIEILGEPILDGYTTSKELSKLDWHKSAVLLPFPNRLRDGRYSFQGQSYQFAINEISNNNQLHGFGYESVFNRTQLDIVDDALLCTYTTDYQGINESYPFPFQFDFSIKMNASGDVEMKMTCKNMGSQAIPFGCGWHPYFKIAESINDLQLTAQSLAKIDLDERMLPTGLQTDFEVFERPRSLRAISLDNVFRYKLNTEKCVVELEIEAGYLSYWQDENCPFIQIFTPNHRKSIAIEPMTCNIDAFNNIDGLWTLAPAEEKTMCFGFSYKTRKASNRRG